MQNFQVTDKELVRQYLDGKDSAFERLLLRHKDNVYTKINFMVKNRALAEDIMQDTFVKVINTLKSGKYNEEGKFLPWMMRIAHNLVIDYFRKNKKMPTVRSNDDYDVFATIKHDDKNVEEAMVSDQISDDVKKVIKQLPQDQKEVLMMRLFYKMSFKEIAEMNNISINTALGRMRYAIINMRKIVDEKNIVLRMN